jgi:hypothetical protein
LIARSAVFRLSEHITMKNSFLREAIPIIACAALIVTFVTPSLAFDTKWHADATRHAMEKHGFSADARLMCQFANYLTDYFAGPGDYIEKLNAHVPAGIPKSGGFGGVDPADVSRLHFDALIAHNQVEWQWKTLEQNTRLALERWAADPAVKDGYRPVVLMTILCASLHAVQDFYSHSNWLKKIPARDGATPVWFDVPEGDRTHANIKSGWYPDGTVAGRLYHREENKDSSARPLNAQAFDAATRASIDWVGRLIAATPGVPWAMLKAWAALPANLNGMWLKKPDASFITTTSTLADHWDGDTPVKNVFAPEPSRNKKMAGEALQLTLGVYFKNISQSSPATPTPHWVGFTIYHVEKALASQLYLQNTVR